jgi:NitT/TauT family transport system substrate-binding protein
MKKLTSLLCALTLTATFITGCGQSSSDITTDPSTELTTQAPSEEALSTEEPTVEESSTEPQSTEEATDPIDLTIMALKGPTAMGMVSFMDEVDSGAITDNNYTFEIAASIDEVTPKLVQGDADIAAVPANMASVLYNNTDGDIQVLAINTLGVLYIVESGNTVTSVADLKGKTIYASGKGATPEYALNYILTENGINPDTDVTIEWKSEHA